MMISCTEDYISQALNMLAGKLSALYINNNKNKTDKNIPAEKYESQCENCQVIVRWRDKIYASVQWQTRMLSSAIDGLSAETACE